MTDGTRSDGYAGAGRPGELVLSSARAEVRQWAADPDTDVASAGTPDGLTTWHAKAEGNAVIDYGLHMIMSDVSAGTLKEMDDLVAEGVPDVKLGRPRCG
jgi:hypothetical protein